MFQFRPPTGQLVSESSFFVGTGGQRLLDLQARSREMLLAAFGQLLASFPELQRGVEVKAALLELAHHLHELVAGFFVSQLTNGLPQTPR